jgi:CRISPR-associated endonuclease/helicase Cas3
MTVPVVAPYGGAAATRERVQLLALLRAPGPGPAWAHRRLRPHLASLPTTLAQRALDEGAVVPVIGDLIEWRGAYHPLRGIELTSPDPQESPQ